MSSLADTSSARLAMIKNEGAMPSTPTLLELPFTSDSLAEKLTSAQSAAMRADRQFSSSRLVRGESSGDVGLEAAFDVWFDQLLGAVLQSDENAGAGFPAPVASSTETIMNGQTQASFLFEKRLQDGEGVFHYDIFQDCQINTLSFDLQANSLANFTIGVRGLDSSTSTDEADGQAGATYTAFDLDQQFDTNSAMVAFAEQDDTAIPVTAQNLSVNIDNQMRGQQAVGSFNDAGTASGRFKVMLSGSIYFRNQTLYNKFKANEGIKVSITLQDSLGNKYVFRMDNVKTTSYELSAGGADQDLVVPIELQAFPATSGNKKTLEIDRIIP